jgi:hypothetical protein
VNGVKKGGEIFEFQFLIFDWGFEVRGCPAVADKARKWGQKDVEFEEHLIG